MYAGYIIKKSEVTALLSTFERQMAIGIAHDHYGEKKKKLHQRMGLFLDEAYNEETDSILMKSIEKDFFPNIRSHIFLSHSSKDEDISLALAGYLWQECGIEVFIDSMLWEYCDDLLKTLDDHFSRSGKSTYYYENRNITTAQVHVLLNMALARMINSTECFIFLDSYNSLRHVNKQISSQETESPWIYSELLLSEIIQKRLPQEHRIHNFQESFSHGDVNQVPTFIYDAMLSKLHPLDRNDLCLAIHHLGKRNTIERNNKRAERFLDYLYEITGVDYDEQ